MNLHEYQAKHLLRDFGVPVPECEVASNLDEVTAICNAMHCDRYVVKAQVHAGGRGKAGGVKIVDSVDAAMSAAKGMLGTNLVTFQTDENGQPVNQVLIEAPSDIANELYLGAVIDRSSQSVTIMASTEGGMDIEEVADSNPEKILTVNVDLSVGLQPYQCRDLFFALNLDASLMRPFVAMLINLYKMIVDCDLSLLEINPLVVTTDNNIICLDAKINIDDNAMYRQPALREMRDPSQEDERENRALQWDLNYIALDGNIGCMVNGAGLAMATMDLIKFSGGLPANFLDVGGGATQERVTEAFKIILSDDQVKGILVNIFGGIVRCDLIADGIIAAVKEVGINIPVVVRLAGNNAELGSKKLAESGLNIIAAAGFAEAANEIVKQVAEGDK